MFQQYKNAYEHTKTVCTIGQYKNVPVNESIKCYYNPNLTNTITDNKPIIRVVPNDCLEVAECFVSYGYNPVVLNIADGSWPGAQIEMEGYGYEESLFCRSNYFKTLNLQNGLYPINGLECIYSKNVLVIKDIDLTPLAKPFNVSFIACAPIKHYKSDILDETEYEFTFMKLSTVFQTAFNKGHDVLVLSAFGCGAYKNPQKQIVEIFNKLIEQYGHLFKFITFAIIPKKEMDGKYILKHNHECNYQAFCSGINS